MKWGLLSDYILKGLLKPNWNIDEDQSEEDQYTPIQLLIAARWACAELSWHTAPTATKEYQASGSTYSFLIPVDCFDNIEKTALVGMKNSNGQMNFIPPVRRFPNTIWDSPDTTHGSYQYYEYPTGRLAFTTNPPEGTVVQLNYFRTWAAPTDEEFDMDIPVYLEQAFCYLVAAIAIEPYGVQRSQIAQWNTKTDSGSPVMNPLIDQTNHYRKQAYTLLTKVSPQDRETFWNLLKTR